MRKEGVRGTDHALLVITKFGILTIISTKFCMDRTHHDRCNIEASLLVHPPPLRQHDSTPHTQPHQNQQDNNQERYDYPQGYGRGIDATRGRGRNCVTRVTTIIKLTTCSTEGGIVWTKTAGSWWTRAITRGSTCEGGKREREIWGEGECHTHQNFNETSNKFTWPYNYATHRNHQTVHYSVLAV